MSATGLLVVGGAGVIAAAANTVAGGGSLLSFPVLLATGISPLAANVTNTVGLVAGQLSGSHGYRAELQGQRRRLLQLSLAMGLGAVSGAALLLVLPEHVFRTIVPWLIIAACLALLAQPRLVHILGGHGGEHAPGLRLGLFLTGVYGGYFGAAVSIMVLALLALFINDEMQRLNAAKVVLSGLANAIAAVAFALFGPVQWAYALVLAAGSLLGGALGAVVARRLPAPALRVGIAVIGLGVAVVLLVRG